MASPSDASCSSPLLFASPRELLSRLLLRPLARLRHDFFPDPANVTPDYWQYWKWRAGHRFFSSMNSALTTQSLLLAVGRRAAQGRGEGQRGNGGAATTGGRPAPNLGSVPPPCGSQAASAPPRPPRTPPLSVLRGRSPSGRSARPPPLLGAAGAAWVLKDGLGRLGRLAVAARFGTGFDADLKRWRFATSVLYCFSGGLEIASPFFPRSWFVPLAAAANAGKGIGLVTHLSTQPAFYRSLARGETTADVAAKCQAQQTVADALGMAAAVLLAGGIAKAHAAGAARVAGAETAIAIAKATRTSKPALLRGQLARPLAPLISRLSRLPPYALPAIAFPILSALDLVCIAGELRSVHLRVMNAERAEALARAWVGSGGAEGNGRETKNASARPLLPSPREVSRREGLLLPSRLLATQWWAERGSRERNEGRESRATSTVHAAHSLEESSSLALRPVAHSSPLSSPSPTIAPPPSGLRAGVSRLPPTPCAWLCPLDRALRSESTVDAFVASVSDRSGGSESSPRFASVPDPVHQHRLLLSLRADARPADALEAVLSSVLFGARQAQKNHEHERKLAFHGESPADASVAASVVPSRRRFFSLPFRFRIGRNSKQPDDPPVLAAVARPRHPPSDAPPPAALPLELPPCEVPAEPSVGACALAARAHAAEALPAFCAALKEAGWEPDAFVFGSAGKRRWTLRP